MAETEMNDEEFKNFIFDNRERIKALLQDDDSEFKGFIKGELKAMKKKAKKAKKKLEKKADAKASGIKEAVFSPEVQKHIVSAGVEMMLGLSAMIDKIPKSEKVQEVFDKASEAKQNASNAYCAKNPDCPRKKAEAKKIELE